MDSWDFAGIRKIRKISANLRQITSRHSCDTSSQNRCEVWGNNKMAMDHFGRLADELVDQLEWIEDHPDLRADGAEVLKHLQRAINAACRADRARRLRREAAATNEVVELITAQAA